MSEKRYLSEKQVMDRYGVTSMTLNRWTSDPKLGFPAPIYIRGRKYRAEASLDAFDATPRPSVADSETFAQARGKALEVKRARRSQKEAANASAA